MTPIVNPCNQTDDLNLCDAKSEMILFLKNNRRRNVIVVIGQSQLPLFAMQSPLGQVNHILRNVLLQFETPA